MYLGGQVPQMYLESLPKIPSLTAQPTLVHIADHSNSDDSVESDQEIKEQDRSVAVEKYNGPLPKIDQINRGQSLEPPQGNLLPQISENLSEETIVDAWSQAIRHSIENLRHIHITQALMPSPKSLVLTQLLTLDQETRYVVKNSSLVYFSIFPWFNLPRSKGYRYRQSVNPKKYSDFGNQLITALIYFWNRKQPIADDELMLIQEMFQLESPVTELLTAVIRVKDKVEKRLIFRRYMTLVAQVKNHEERIVALETKLSEFNGKVILPPTSETNDSESTEQNNLRPSSNSLRVNAFVEGSGGGAEHSGGETQTNIEQQLRNHDERIAILSLISLGAVGSDETPQETGQKRKIEDIS